MRRRNSMKKMLIMAFVLLVVIISFVLLYFAKSNKRIAEENAQLKQTISDYEANQTTVYILTNDVKAGNKIMETDLTTANVPKEAVPQNAITDETMLEKKLYKTDLSANTMLSGDMILDEELTDDMRELDVVMTEVPIGLAEGDYIDVRIAFPLGQDFLALSHKKVVAINGNAVKLVVGEQDFYSYESMKADYGTYQAVKIYGAKYVESGIQQSAVVYYPVSVDILKTEILDPNINTSDYKNTLKRRKKLEEQLIDADLVEKNEKVTYNKAKLDELFNEAEQAYAQLQEEKEQQAAMEENGTVDENAVSLN